MFRIYQKLIGYVPERKGFMLLGIFFAAVSATAQVGAMYYLYTFLKALLDGHLALLQQEAVKMAILMLGSMLSYFLALALAHVFAFRLETNLRKFGIEGLTRASFRFFDRNPSGKVRKLIDDNAAMTHTAVAHLIPDNTGGILSPILLMVLAYTVSWRVGVALTIIALLNLLLLGKMTGNQEAMRIYTESLENLSAQSVEYVRGIQVVKLFAVDIEQFKAFHQAIKTYADYAMSYSLSCRWPFVSFQVIFFGCGLVLMPLAVLFLPLSVNLQLEMLMIIFLSGVLFIYMMRIMYISMHLYQANNAVSKLEALYDAMHEDNLSFQKETHIDSFSIRFDRVAFAYEQKPVIQDFSFTFKEGHTYALVGQSGCGKSTIAKLMSGFYNVTNGTIYLGDKPLSSYDQQAVARHIAFVFQDTKLFHRSIYDNVALADPQADEAEVMEALRLAECEAIYQRFPQGVHTLIGAKGIHLSGGERQRIAIARAILKKADIIIFDEASAALDPENEYLLQRAFQNLMRGKTVLMIAHRLSSIQGVDEIIVMADGTIVEHGSPQELRARKQAYYAFEKHYFAAGTWRVNA